MNRCAALLVFVAITWTVPAWGSGILVPDAGIKAFGRGGAFTALADDTAALYYNPAGLWQMDGFRIGGGLLGLQQINKFTRAGGAGTYKLDSAGNIIVDAAGEPVLAGSYETVENQDVLRPIPELSISYGFENPDLTIALGVYAPLAPWVSYPQYGASRYRMYHSRILQGNFCLSAGWKIADFIAIGAGFQVLYIEMRDSFYATADIETEMGELNPENPQWDVNAVFEATEWKPYWNVGVMIMPADIFRIGVSFQPPYTFRGKGSVELSGEVGGQYLEDLQEAAGSLITINDTSPMNLTGLDEELTVSTTLPAVLRTGFMLAPTAWFNVELDAIFEFWSAADQILAEGIDVPLESCEGGDCVPFTDELNSRVDDVVACETGLIDCSALEVYEGNGDGTYTIKENYKNTFSIRFGGEIQPVPEHLGFRFGYLFETSAVPDSTLNDMIVDSNKHLLGCGVSGMWRGFEVHFSYAHVFYDDRDIAVADSEGLQTGLEGTTVSKIDAGLYESDVNILGLTLVFDFTGMHKVAKEKRAAKVAHNDALLSMSY